MDLITCKSLSQLCYIQTPSEVHWIVCYYKNEYSLLDFIFLTCLMLYLKVLINTEYLRTTKEIVQICSRFFMQGYFEL